MHVAEESRTSAFAWNAGGWFGTQAGGSVWVLALGAVLLFVDPVSAMVCLGGFTAFNAYGLYLWRRQEQLSAYSVVQRLLCATGVFYALVIGTVNCRRVADVKTPLGVIQTQMPYWCIALPFVLMLLFFMREQKVTKNLS